MPIETSREPRASMGTVAYMSPEQANGAEVGPVSDVFSFGVLAYELLTGRRPFEGHAPGEVIAAIVNGRYQPIADRRIEVPPELAAVVERCLQVAPADRFQSGTDVVRALRRALAGEDRPDALEDRRALRRRRRLSSRRSSSAPPQTACLVAYSAVGSGPFLVRVLGHFTHLEMEWEWPDLRRFWEHLAEHHTVVRYDGRGMGLSDRYSGEFSEETRQFDLEAVLDAVGADKVVAARHLRGRMDGSDLRQSTSGTSLAPHPVRRLLPRSAGQTGI